MSIVQEPRLMKTTIIYFIGNFSSKLLTFFLLPLYTAYLTPADFGQVDLLLSALPLLAPIFTLQATESIFRFLCGESSIEKIRSAISNAALIFVAGCTGFVAFYIPFFLHFKFQYGVLFLVYFLSTYTGIFLQQVLRGLKRNTEYAIMGVVSTLVQAVVNIALIIQFHLHGESLLISAIAASLVISLFMVLRIKIWQYIKRQLIKASDIKAQLVYSIPLIPNQICWWAVGIMGKYFVLFFTGIDANGILALASKFPNLFATVNSIFFLAWVENTIFKFNQKENDRYFTEKFHMFTSLELALLILVLPVTKAYNILTISAGFSDAWKYIPFLYLGALFNGMAAFLGSIYTASMQTKPAFTTSVIAAAVNIVACFVLIPKIGILGEVIANMVAFIVFFIVRVRSVNKIIKVQMRVPKYIPSIMLLILSLLVYYRSSLIGQLIFMLVAGIVLIYINREFLQSIFQIFRKLLPSHD